MPNINHCNELIRETSKSSKQTHK